MKMIPAFPLLAFLLLAAPVHAERLTVLELFTSQGCSSCPPADALLAELSRGDPALLPLGLHVTYWDRGGWKDPYSLPAATQRQREAQGQLRTDAIYTPQLVIDGHLEAIGSDRPAVHRAIAAAKAAPRSVDLSLVNGPDGLRLHAGAGRGEGTLVLVGFDARHETQVRGGENGGRRLEEVNVVRAITPVATWSGAATDLMVTRPAGERVAALLRGTDGRILAAAILR